MRYSPEHKDATHTRILDAASRLLMREGVKGSSVERVMKAAGMTVGGFYAHFTSKKSLVIETVRHALSVRRKFWLGAVEDLEGDAMLEQFVRVYLSRAHRDNPDESLCPLPASLSELAREELDVREALAEELNVTLAAITPRIKGKDARQRAVAALTQAVGGLILARATAGTPLSDEFIAAGRAQFAKKK